MKRYLLDTNTMGHFINRRRGVDERVKAAHLVGCRIGTCLPVVGELFFGIEHSATRTENHKRLLHALSRIPCWPFDRAAAEQYGKVAADLRSAGRPIQQIDMQIAAIALALGNCTVVTTDSDLSFVPSLNVENWAS